MSLQQEMKQSLIEAAKEYEEERSKIKELREKQRNQDEILTDFYHNRQVRLQCKINHVLKEVYMSSPAVSFTSFCILELIW